MVYKGLSWSCFLFGLSVFWLSYEIVRFQQTAPEIISNFVRVNRRRNGCNGIVRVMGNS